MFLNKNHKKRSTIVHDIKIKSKPKLPSVLVTKYNPCIKDFFNPGYEV